MSESRQAEMSAEEINAFVTLAYERYATDVLRVSYFYLGDRQKAEDVMQEAYIRLMSNIRRVDREKVKQWLLKVALNLCRDVWRSNWAKRVLLGSPKLEMVPGDNEIDRRTEKQALLEAVHALPAPTREVFLLFYYQGYKAEEIAEMTGAAVGTVCSRLTRGRRQLKEILKESEWE